MMHKWQKIPCTLSFVINQVEVRKQTSATFELFWSRGDNEGQTTKMPVTDNVIPFQAKFTCPCTIFMSKADHKIRKKDVKFRLMINNMNAKPRVYGKLTVDVARFYGLVDPRVVDMEMESGHSEPPRIHGSFQIVQTGQAHDFNGNPNSDASFIGSVPQSPKHPIEWDKTEKTDPYSYQPSPFASPPEHSGSVLSQFQLPKRSLKKREGRPPKSPKSRKKGSSEKNDHSEKGERAVQFGWPDKKSSPKSLSSIGFAHESPQFERETSFPREPNQSQFHEEESEVETIFATEKTAAEAHGAILSSPSRSSPQFATGPTRVTVPRSTSQFAPIEDPITTTWFFKILSRQWEPPLRQNYLDSHSTYAFPNAIFPLFSALLNCHILQADGHPLESFLARLATELPRAPLQPGCSPETRFVTVLVLHLLVSSFGAPFGLDAARCQQFSAALRPVLDAAFTAFAESIINASGGDVITNRLATGVFDVDEVIPDFTRVVSTIKSLVMMPTSQAKRLSLKMIVAAIDAKTVAKILAVPMRLSFGHSISWTSFATAVETGTGTSFTFLRELSSLVMMSPRIIEDPPQRNEFCPHLSPKTITFILRNIRPDEMMDYKLEWEMFARRFAVGLEDGPDEIAPNCLVNYDSLAETIRIGEWDNVEVDGTTIDEFPFLEDYMKRGF